MFGGRAHLRQATFAEMTFHASALGWKRVDGILLDLGLSSMQLDDPARGFAKPYFIGMTEVEGAALPPFAWQEPGEGALKRTPVGPQLALANFLLADLYNRLGDDGRSREYARRGAAVAKGNQREGKQGEAQPRSAPEFERHGAAWCDLSDRIHQETGERSVSLDLLVRTLLALGASNSDVVRLLFPRKSVPAA